MANKIGWTEQTWNPVIGCEKISIGCSRCYAEQFAKRLVNNPNPKISDKYLSVISPNGWTGKTHLEKSELDKPFKWKKPKMIFVESMGDLFHKSVKVDWIAQVFATIFLNERHTFQILTKRPDIALSVFESKRFKEYLHKYCNQLHDKYIKTLESELYFYDEIMSLWPFKNCWFGTTVENQEYANKRIPILLKIPAAKRFISCEPLLDQVDLKNIQQFNSESEHIASYQVLEPIFNCGDSSRPALDLVICGPETGTKARPMQKEWIELLFSQCKAANVPFFDKKNILGLTLNNFQNGKNV
jgi:protein gp37